jgi:carboxypeptidase C (cathepsin A)
LAPVFVQTSFAQFSPPVTYDKVLKSPINPNITISYKTPDPDTCKTVFENQTQYTGYVTLPPYTLAPIQQNYTINTFFWFVESRTSPETAPLTIWLNGGPGSSSMLGLFTEAGPCEVIQLPDGSYGTQSSLWGWDRSSNMLFIDQPTQTGFSYDEKTNGTVDLSDYSFESPPVQVQSTGHDIRLNGTLSTGNEYSTQNTSIIAASASWHFLQGFLSAFPQYNPGTRPNSTTTEPTGINLFAESYGGQYGPAFADFFETQNAKRLSGELSRNGSLEVKLASLGIINGIVDEMIQAPWWPKFAFNNTYGIEAISQTDQLNALSDFRAPGGCSDLIGQCRDSLKTNDPLGEGDEQATNDICARAAEECTNALTAALTSGRSAYDIRIEGPDTFPSYAFMEYLNTASVQRSIGAGINFTQSNFGVFGAFAKSKFSATCCDIYALILTGIQLAMRFAEPS